MFPLRIARPFLVLLLVIISAGGLLAQQKTVTGSVTNSETGNAMPGVSVSVKGTTETVITDGKGNFSIQVPSSESFLSFTHIGFTTQEITVGDRNSFSVHMDVQDKQLEEVIYVGYGSQKKELLTNAVEALDMKAVRDLPVGSLALTLRGQINGVSVSGGQSRPGDPATIVVRNAGSFVKSGGSVEPIYVVDDVVKSADEFKGCGCCYLWC
jgi:hypothetical protein